MRNFSMSLAESRPIAAAIDARVKELIGEGTSERLLLERMVPFLPELNRIWNSTSDATLKSLCREFPGFYRYAALMEEGSAAWQAGGGPAHSGPELPPKIKTRLVELLAEANALDRELQALLAKRAGPAAPDAAERGVTLTTRAREWREGIAALDAATSAQGVPAASRAIVASAFGPLIERIGCLHRAVCG